MKATFLKKGKPIKESTPDPEGLIRLEKTVLEIFSEQDFHNSDMRTIAKKAEISFATIYKYYRSKEKLLFFFINKWMKELADRQLDHLQGLEDLKEKLRKIVWVNMDFYEKNPGVGKIIFMTVPQKAWMSDESFIQKDFIGVFLEVLKEGQEKGYLNSEVRPGTLLDFIYGVIIRSFIMWIYRGQKESFTAQANILFEMIWEGISNTSLKKEQPKREWKGGRVMEKKKRNQGEDLTRREFLKTTAAVGALTATGSLTAPFSAIGAAKEIKVGLDLAYSGPFAFIGPRAEAAIRYAFSKSKYRDNVKFFPEDSQNKPEVAVEKAQKLVEKEGVDILVGPLAGHEALAVSEYCKSKKKLMLLVYGGNVRIAGSNCSRYTFLCGHTTYSISAPALPWIVNNLGKQIFLIGSDYSTGHDICGYFKEGALKMGATIVGEAYPPLGHSEFAPYLSQIMNSKPKPKVVAGFVGGSDLVNFTKQFSEFGLKKEGIVIVTTIGQYSAKLIEAMGNSAEGMYDIFHWAPTLANKENIEFMAGFAKYAKMEADDAAVLGYDVGTTITYALDQTGGDTDNEKLIAAIEKRRWKSPRGECSFGPNHCIVHPVYVRMVKRIGGKLSIVAVANVGQHTTPGDATGPGGKCQM